jgi:hypothetical protein
MHSFPFRVPSGDRAMAIVTVPAETRQITDPAEIKAFLAERGLDFAQWPLEDRVDPAAGVCD